MIYSEVHISTTLRLIVNKNKKISFNNIRQSASNDSLITIGQTLFNLTSYDTLEGIFRVTINEIVSSDEGEGEEEGVILSPIKLSDGKELVTSNGEIILFSSNKL